MSKNTFCRLLVSHRDDCASFENVKTLVIVRYHQPRPIFTTTDEETGRRGRISISSGWRHQTPAHCRVTVQHAGLDQKDNASKQKTQEQTRHSHADTRDALRVLCWDNKVFNKKKGGLVMSQVDWKTSMNCSPRESCVSVVLSLDLCGRT